MEENLPLRRSTRHSVVAKTEELTPRKRNAATPVKVEPSTPSRRTRASSTTPKKSLFESVTTPKKILPVLNEEETPKKKRASKAILKIKDKEGSPKKSDLIRTPKRNVNGNTVHVGVKDGISTPKKNILEDGPKILVESSEEIHVVGGRPLTRAKRKTMAANPIIEINTKSLDIEKRLDSKEGDQIDKSVNIVDTTNNYSDNKSELKIGVESCLALVPKIIITDFSKQILKEANVADNGKEIDHVMIRRCNAYESKSPLKAEDIPIKSPKKAPEDSKSIPEASLVVNNTVIGRSIDMSEDTSRSPKKNKDYNSKKSVNSDGKSPVKLDPFSSKSPINRNLISVTSSRKVTGIEDLVNSSCVVTLEKVSCGSPKKMHTADSSPNFEEAALQLEANNTFSEGQDKDTNESCNCDPSTIGTSAINDSGMIPEVECREKQSESKEVPTEILKNFANVSETPQVNTSAGKNSTTKLESGNDSDIEIKELKLAKIANENSPTKLKDILNSNNHNCLENVSVAAEEVEKSSETVHVAAETFENSENVSKTISVEIVTDMKSPKTTEYPDFDNQKLVKASELVLPTVVNDVSSSKSNNISSSAAEMSLENESVSSKTANKVSINSVVQIASETYENSENVPKNMGTKDKRRTPVKPERSNMKHLKKIIDCDSPSASNSDLRSSTALSDVLFPNRQITVENEGSNLSDLDAKNIFTIQTSADDPNVSKILPIKIDTDKENSSKAGISDSETELKIETNSKQNTTKPNVSVSPSKETGEVVITEMVTNDTSTKIGITALSNNLNTTSAISKKPDEVENIIYSNDDLVDAQFSECKCISNSDSKPKMAVENEIKCKRCITAQDMRKDVSKISRDVSDSLIDVTETCDTDMISSTLTCETKENATSLVNKENVCENIEQCEKVNLKTVIPNQTSESISEFQNVMTEIRSSSEVNGSVINCECSTENISKIEAINNNETNRFESKNQSSNISDEDLNVKGIIQIVKDDSIKTCQSNGVHVSTVQISSINVTKDVETISHVLTPVEMKSSNETQKITCKDDGLDTVLMSPKDFLKSDDESVIDEVPLEKSNQKKSRASVRLHSKTNDTNQQDSQNIDNEIMIMNNDKNMKASAENVEAIEHGSSEIINDEQVNFTVIDSKGKSSVTSIPNFCQEVNDEQQQLTSSDGVSSGGLTDEIVTPTNINDKITNEYDNISNVSSLPIKNIEGSFQNKVAEDVYSYENSSFNSSSVVGRNEIKLGTVDNASEGEQIETNCSNKNNHTLSEISEHKETHDNDLKTFNGETILKEDTCLLQSGNVASENESDSKMKTRKEIKLQNKQCKIEKCSPRASRSKKDSELDVSLSSKDELTNNDFFNEEKTSETRLKNPKYKRIVLNDSTSDSDESSKIVVKKKKTSRKSVSKKKKIFVENSGSETYNSSDLADDHYPSGNDCHSENKYPTDNQISAKDFIDFEAEVGEEWSEDSSVSEEVSSSTSSVSASSDFINFEAKESKKKRSLEIDASDGSDYIDSVNLLFCSPTDSFPPKNKKTKLEKVSIESEKKSRTSNQKSKKSNKEVIVSLIDNESLKNTKTRIKSIKEFTKTGVFLISSIRPNLKKTKLPRIPNSTKCPKSIKKSVKKTEFSSKGFSVSPQIDNTSCKGFIVTQIKSDSEAKKPTERGTVQTESLKQKTKIKVKSNIENSKKKSVKKSLKGKDNRKEPFSFVATFILPHEPRPKSLEEALELEGITYVSINFVKPKVALVEFSNEESFKKVLGLYGKLKIDNKPVYILEGNSCV